MTKIFLVDDEKLERVLIKKSYDWEANGFEIIGEASSGEEALEFFSVKEPDIVFTDINMPYMDGLVLAEKIKERLPKCRIVIITGYREFEYARKAVRLEVEDFILKPINIKDVVALAEMIKKQLEQEQGQDEELHRLKETVSNNQEIIMESFLQRLVANHIEEEEALHKLQMFSLEGLLEKCVCIDVKLHLEPDQEEEALTFSRKIAMIIKAEEQNQQITFIHYLCNIVIYFYGDAVDEIQKTANQILYKIKKESGLCASVGISRVEKGFSGISRAYRQAEKAISASVIMGRDCCISYEDYSSIKNVNNKNMELHWKDFIFDVENSLKDKVFAHIDRLTEFMKNSGVTDANYLKLMTMDMLSKAESPLTKQGKSLGQLVGEQYLHEQVVKIGTVEEMRECLKRLISAILKYSDSRRRKSNKLVDQAMEYIEEQLGDPLLTLKTIASKVYANESYLSRIFKQDVGESLIEYITRKRIEKSIELLNTTDLKVYEIAEKVGFSNSHYFSICFKKHVGVTIKEYKKPKY